MMTFKKALLKSIGLLFSIFIISILLSTKLYAQFQIDYPFKAISDESGNIYITGEVYNASNGTMDILLKYVPAGGWFGWEEVYASSAGDDKGFGIALDINDKPVITGYVYNNATSSNDIIILRYDEINSNWDLDRVITSPYDDAGLSVAITPNNDIAVCGYITTKTTGKDYYTCLLNDDAGYFWYHTFDYSNSKRDDIATTILADASYLYSGGYGICNIEGDNDLIFIDFEIPPNPSEEPSVYGYPLTPDQVIEEGNPNIDEKLTSYAITDIAQDLVSKSKRVGAATIENIPISPGNEDYLTLRIDTDMLNFTFSVIVWDTTYGDTDYAEIPTAVTSDETYIYVTGYQSTYDEGYNFRTLQYKKDHPDEGTLTWQASYNNNDMDDQPSSIGISGGLLYVTGYSEAATSEYIIVSYNPSQFSDNSEDSSEANFVWKKSYTPELRGINLNDLKKYTYCAGDNNGNVIMMVFGYNDDVSFYSGQTYDARGNVINTISPVISTKNNKNIDPDLEGNITSVINYPNPFNPVTTIQFKIALAGLVEMEIYDITGRRIESLLRENLMPGVHEVKWNATRVSSGTYFYTIKTNNQVITKKLVVIK